MSNWALTLKCFHPEVMHIIFFHIHWTEPATWAQVTSEVEGSVILSVPEMELYVGNWWKCRPHLGMTPVSLATAGPQVHVPLTSYQIAL